MKGRGLVVVELSPEERALWRAEVDSALPELRKLLGPEELYEMAKRHRDEFRASGNR
jgi:hypothetical protein